MKNIMFFLAGIVTCFLLVWGISGLSGTVNAQESDPGFPTIQLPDINKIFRTSLAEPYRQVEKEITDPEIANYYRQLMQKTGLDRADLDY